MFVSLQEWILHSRNSDQNRQPINQSTVTAHSKNKWTLCPVIDWLIDWLSDLIVLSIHACFQFRVSLLILEGLWYLISRIRVPIGTSGNPLRMALRSIPKKTTTDNLSCVHCSTHCQKQSRMIGPDHPRHVLPPVVTQDIVFTTNHVSILTVILFSQNIFMQGILAHLKGPVFRIKNIFCQDLPEYPINHSKIMQWKSQRSTTWIFFTPKNNFSLSTFLLQDFFSEAFPTRQSAWVEKESELKQGVPMASGREQMFLEGFLTVGILRHAACHSFNSGALLCIVLFVILRLTIVGHNTQCHKSRLTRGFLFHGALRTGAQTHTDGAWDLLLHGLPRVGGARPRSDGPPSGDRQFLRHGADHFAHSGKRPDQQIAGLGGRFLGAAVTAAVHDGLEFHGSRREGLVAATLLWLKKNCKSQIFTLKSI